IFSQSVLTSLKLSPFIVANLLALIELGTSFSYLVAGGVAARISLRPLLYGTFALLAIMVGLNAFAVAWMSLISLAIAMLVPTVFLIALEMFFHSQIPNRLRASFFSVNSLVQSIFISLTFLGLGFLLDRMPESHAIAWLAVFPLMGFALAAFYFEKMSPVRV